MISGRRKERIRKKRKKMSGRERKSRKRGREQVDDQGEVDFELPGTSTEVFCPSTFGLQMIRGLTWDMLS